MVSLPQGILISNSDIENLHAQTFRFFFLLGCRTRGKRLQIEIYAEVQLNSAGLLQGNRFFAPVERGGEQEEVDAK